MGKLVGADAGGMQIVCKCFTAFDDQPALPGKDKCRCL